MEYCQLISKRGIHKTHPQWEALTPTSFSFCLYPPGSKAALPKSPPTSNSPTSTLAPYYILLRDTSTILSCSPRSSLYFFHSRCFMPQSEDKGKVEQTPFLLFLHIPFSPFYTIDGPFRPLSHALTGNLLKSF